MRPGPRSRVLAALALLAAGGLACPLRVPFGEALFFRHDPPPPHPQARDCERCHQEVYREWEASPHARAWRSESFQQASAGGRAEACTGCHAAAPVAPDAAPTLRDAHREEGVTCLTCHLSPDPEAAPLTMRGPVARTSPVEVHPIIEADPFYRDSGLCGSCHRASFAEWRAAADAKTPTCQGCHMPEVRRTVESVHDEHAYSRLFVALEETQTLRRHVFAVPEDTDERVELEAVRSGPALLRVQVRNRLPHALPTGSFGRRALRVTATRGTGTTRAPLVASSAEAIEAGATRELELPIPDGAPGAPLEVSLERFDRVSGDWQRLERVPVSDVAGSPAR